MIGLLNNTCKVVVIVAHFVRYRYKIIININIMNTIDALTLQLLTSKKVYNNYLSTTDKDKAQKNQEYKEFVLNNQERIKTTIMRYLKDPFIQITTELDENMENLLKALWYHFETLDREAKQKDDENDDEFDTMFLDKPSYKTNNQKSHSFFGKQIFKTSNNDVTLNSDYDEPNAPTDQDV